MTPGLDVQKQLRRYLLGQLPPAEQEQIEKDLMTDANHFEELLAIEDEIVDDYLSGELAAGDRAAFENHFLSTPERQEQLKFGRAFKNLLSQSTAIAEPQPEAAELVTAHSAFRWARSLLVPPWRVAVLVVVVIGVALGAWRLFFHQSEVDKGLQALNAAYRDSRPIETRISDLSYAPYLQTRGGPSPTDQDKLRLAELNFAQALKAGPTAQAHQGLGKVYLARHEFDKAIEELEEALRNDSRNASVYNDLGITWMEKGLSAGGEARLQPAEGGRALGYLNQALRLDPKLSEAIFNRAICYERLGKTEEARHDWETYLEVDPNSPWSAEARERLRRLNETRR